MTVFLLLFTTLFTLSTWAHSLPPPNTQFLKNTEVKYPKSQDRQRKKLLQQVKKWSQKKLRPSVQLWSQYTWAQLTQSTHPSKSCQLFTELSKNSHFPLANLSNWRAQEVCSHPLDLRLKAPLKSQAPPEWLKDLNLDIQIANAKKKRESNLYMDGLVLKSKRNLPISQKIQLVQTAIEYAKENNLKKKIKPLYQRLYKLAPRFIPQPQPSQYLFVAKDFLKTRQFKKSLMYYKAIINGNFSTIQKIKAFQGARRLYKLKRDHPSHLRVSIQLSVFIRKQYHKSKKPSLKELSFKADMNLARVYWTQNNRTQARKVLQHIQKTFKKEYSMAKVYWIRGRMHEEKGNPSAALWWYNLALKEKFNTGELGELKEKIMWYKAWNLRKLNRHRETIELLTQMIKKTKGSFPSSRYLYWIAQSHRDLKQEHQGVPLLEKLAKEDPIGFYGLLAHRALGRPIQWPSKVKNLSPPSLDPHLKKRGFQPKYIEWLLAVSENKIAKLYLDEMSKQYHQLKENSNQQQETWTQILYYYARAGHYLGLFYQLGQLPGKIRRQILSKNPEIIFPHPFYVDVQQASQQFGIDVEYIYSIMRQESAFNPKARSSADALGLLQVLPELGVTAHKNFKIPYQKMEDLYNPSTNIQVGTSYLKQLWKQYDGQFILATAAYNANQKAIHQWLKTRYAGDSLTFIEDIPYEETRNYVKLVMRNFIFYQVLSNHKKPTPFPESCLKLNPQRVLSSTPSALH